MYTFSFFTVIHFIIRHAHFSSHFICCFEKVHAGNQLFRFGATSTRRGGERKQGGRREKEEQRRGNKDRDEERKWGGGRRRDKIGDRTGMRKGEETGRGEETKKERRAWIGWEIKQGEARRKTREEESKEKVLRKEGEEIRWGCVLLWSPAAHLRFMWISNQSELFSCFNQKEIVCCSFLTLCLFITFPDADMARALSPWCE